MNTILYNTKIVSFIIQIVTGIIGVYALFQSIPDEKYVIKQSLSIEMFVQIIQMSMYIILIRNVDDLSNMAKKRYIDWILTTPLMLISLMLYLKYEKYLKEKKDTKNILKEFMESDLFVIFIVIISNFFMLLFGLLGEYGFMKKITAVLIGFIFLIITLLMIYINYVKDIHTNLKIFIPFSIVWSLYGIAYMLDDLRENVFYNVLDVVAKNLFGLFLSVEVIRMK
jgi:bacteriorhodopsin